MMMGCNIVCGLGLVLAIQLVYFYIVEIITDPTGDYQKSLNEKQLALYKQIVERRRTLFHNGIALGLALSALWILFEVYTTRRVSVLRMMCVGLAGSLAVSNLYYTLAPKKIHMLDVLDTKERIAGWKRVYYDMQRNYVIGGIVGVAVALGLGYNKMLTCA